ncbi:MAG: DNA primase [Chloroflexota bacterium]|nr:DNA primase [Chloroflexota bacterium]
MSVVDDVKSRLDIVAYIQRYVPLNKSGRTYKACCPFHTERTPSFHVNPDRGTWRCFGACATGGNIFDFAMRYHGWNFKEALDELAKQAGVEVRPDSPERKAHEAELERLRGIIAAAVDFYHQRLFDPSDPNAVAALTYAYGKRGLTGDTLRAFHIGYAPQDWQQLTDALKQIGYSDEDLLAANLSMRGQRTGKLYDTFRHRLMIPIRDERGRTVGFGARALDPNERAKYINTAQTPIFDKGKLLFGLDRAAKTMRDTDTAVIVEGYLDAIQAHQAGYTNVVAQMGTALTEAQLRLIAPRRAHRIIMALDSDAAGQSATRRSLEVARNLLQTHNTGKLTVDLFVLMMDGNKDPDDLIRENPDEWKRLIENPTPLARYVIDTATSLLPPNASLSQRQDVASSLIPLLLPTEKSQQSKDNIQRLALKLKLQEQDIFVLEARVRQQEEARAKTAGANANNGSGTNGHSPKSPPARAALTAPDDLPPEAPPSEGDYLPGLDVGWDADLTALPGMTEAVGLGTLAQWEGGIEKDCLRRLLHQPNLYYHINGKFRALAGGDSVLASGWLSEFSPDDFRLDTYNALMRVFEEAMRQDDLTTLDYMRTHLDHSLNHELDIVMMDEWDELYARLRYITADLFPSVTKVQRLRVPLVPETVVFTLALILRERRLRREEESLRFLLRDTAEDETEGNPSFINKLKHVQQLRRRLQVESSLRKIM